MQKRNHTTEAMPDQSDIDDWHSIPWNRFVKQPCLSCQRQGRDVKFSCYDKSIRDPACPSIATHRKATVFVVDTALMMVRILMVDQPKKGNHTGFRSARQIEITPVRSIWFVAKLLTARLQSDIVQSSRSMSHHCTDHDLATYREWNRPPSIHGPTGPMNIGDR